MIELTIGLNAHAPFFYVLECHQFFAGPDLMNQSDLMVLFERNTKAHKEKTGQNRSVVWKLT
jgi:hypothetical protein